MGSSLSNVCSYGRSASYIPALGKINVSQLGICIVKPDETMIKAGDWEVPFTLQSISKVIGFIAACLSRVFLMY